MLTVTLVGRARQIEPHDVLELGGADRVSRNQHAAPDQAGRLRHLVGAHAGGHGLQAAVHVLDALHRAELRHLAGHLGVVERVQRVLVLHLRNQQAQKTILGICGAVLRCPGGASAEQAADIARVLYRTHGVSSFIGPGPMS